MTLDGNVREPGGATLDELFRRACTRGPDTLALIDPGNREGFTGGPPRWLTYAQADRAISAIAARLQLLGLPTGSVVALQLPNTVDSVIALLGVLRAGMIAAPLPLLWRKQEIVTALGSVGARTIITCSRVDATAHADMAREVAAELFVIRHVCGFGRDLPDGVVPLDDCIDAAPLDFGPPPPRADQAGAYVAVVTFEVAAGGLVAVARNHTELIAGGLAAMLEAGIDEDATILSAIPLGSFAGIALTLLPWVIRGGALALHHGFDADIFAAQCHSHDAGTAIVPAAALSPLAEAGLLGSPVDKILALWRAPEQLAAAAPWRSAATLVDAASFGEIGLVAARRGADGRQGRTVDGYGGRIGRQPDREAVARL